MVSVSISSPQGRCFWWGALCRALVCAVFAVFGILSAFAQTATAPVVRYPVEAGRDVENNFSFKVLKLALEKTGGDWQLVPAAAPMNESRSKLLLEQGWQIDVAWYGSYAELEERLFPIRIPINKGLLSWRLLLIDGRQQDKFSAVRTIEDLRRLTLVQGEGWTDVDILRAAGFSVQETPYETAFKMVGAGRVDGFPRGASEAYFEQANTVDHVPNLAVEKSLVIHYPLAKLFFVRKGNAALHAAIREGLEKAHADGSYDALFFSHPPNRQALEFAGFKNRRKFSIENPLLSEETASIPDKYWYRP
ncbi:extracellular solute-binding protein (family 3) [Roseibium hamelinense]|uniref:Extracellular solute-binding protein (Family 3) n=1 Tax=Roseibium hamelinense TaxID=150831 RepID=A0A562TJ21_9HYPH|nr:transporter substrate-binding domain-containing protein [Roseibium hamelinense]MTI42618.1 transporter substrate-binding domain-containing protein [Roseibium hamelinense]TWI93364.1 extracellular solute-binding protein (family 3) [Roseibium hamelinense]